MPTGKIISFLHGEISPSFRFKTNLASFATGLTKLYNSFVRKSGGVANRPGFEYVATPLFQSSLKIPGRLRLLALRAPVEEDQDTDFEVVILHPSLDTETIESFSELPITTGQVLTADFDLKNVKVSQNGDEVIISNGLEHSIFRFSNLLLQLGAFTRGKIQSVPNIPSTVLTAPDGFVTFLGAANNRPVAYKYYQVLRSGEEVLFNELRVLQAIGVSQPLQPFSVSGNSSFNTINVALSSDSRIKHYNVYRTSFTVNDADSDGPWGLVGRIPTPTTDKIVPFNDYLEQADVRIPPPDQDYLYGEGQTPGVKDLNSARLVGHHQQRRYAVANPATSKLEEGSVSLSKLGAVNQFDTQALFTSLGAFDYTIPIGTKKRILATIDLEKTILLTKDAVIVVSSSRDSVISPSTVAPYVASQIGTSETVTPVVASGQGFFVDTTGNRLMRVATIRTKEGSSVSVDDASYFSDHLMDDKVGVKELAVTRGKEDIVWILKKDGTLCSVTVHGDGQLGWAGHDTDGYIESIASVLTSSSILSVTSDKEYESLYISVVREGVRYIERSSKREDDGSEGYNYVDSGMNFGSRLELSESGTVYFRKVHLDDTDLEVEDHIGLAAGPKRKAWFVGVVPGMLTQAIVRAVEFGTKSNLITVVGDGALTVTQLFTAWNGANPLNQVLLPLTSGGAEVPNNGESITLSQGYGQNSQVHGGIINITSIGGYEETDDVTLTRTGTGDFKAITTEVQVIDFYYKEDGIEKTIRWTQTGFVSPTVATGRFDREVPVALQDVASQLITADEKTLIQTRWLRVRNRITGLIHLANKDVSIFVDGKVLSSPLNTTEYETVYTVDGAGVIELGDYYGWGVIGLPYFSEVESLPLDSSDERTFADSNKLINRLGVAFHESRGGQVGLTGEEEDLQMESVVVRENEFLEQETENLNGYYDFSIPGQWEPTGQVKIRQVDPLPQTVLSIYPKGLSSD